MICTNGFDAGVSDLKFRFADRYDGADRVACLWSTPSRAASANEETIGSDIYRYVELDAAKLTAQDVAAVYGVSDLTATTIPVAERTIEMYVMKRLVPETGNAGAAKVGDFVGYLSWKSGGENYSIPLVAETSVKAKALKSLKVMAAPISLAALNTSLAVGAVVTADSNPYCKLTAFNVGDSTISGTVEGGAGATKGMVGNNATVVLWGAADLNGLFVKIGSVSTDSSGGFTIEKPDGYTFFKVSLDIVNVAE